MSSDLVLAQQARSLDLSGPSRRAIAAFAGDDVARAIAMRVVDVKKASFMAIVALMIDNSLSSTDRMEDDVRVPGREYRQVLAAAANAIIDAVRGVTRNVVVLVCGLNGPSPLHAPDPWIAFAPIARVPRPAIEDQYECFGRTPFHLRAMGFLGGVHGYAVGLGDRGIPTSITAAFLGDCRDNESRGVTAANNAKIVQELEARGAAILGLGVGPDGVYRPVYKAMGLRDGNIRSAAGAAEFLAAAREAGQHVQHRVQITAAGR